MSVSDEISKYVSKYLKFHKSQAAKEWELEREKRQRIYSKLLSKENIENLSEENFSEIIKTLYASQIWTNKEYLVQKILKNNGLQKIMQNLKGLLYGSSALETRFDKFRGEINGLGPSSITEIMSFVNPKEFGLWNQKPKKVFPFLGITDLPKKVYKYQIDGKQYVLCLEKLENIRTELEKNGLKNPDLIDVDFFLAFLFYEVLPKEQPKIIDREKVSEEKIEEKILESEQLQSGDLHERVCEMLEWIGQNSGYTVKKKYKVAEDSPYQIDVTWLRKEEIPEIAFEVHIGGSLEKDKDSLNLAKKFNFRKVIWVCEEKDIERIKKLLKHDDLKNWVELWSPKTIFKLYNIGSNFYSLFKTLEKSEYKELKELEII